MVVNMDW